MRPMLAIYAANAEKSWSEVHADWRRGFLQLLEAAEPISEKDLLNADRVPWLKGYSPAFILVASYDHHQEHLEWVIASLHEPRK